MAQERLEELALLAERAEEGVRVEELEPHAAVRELEEDAEALAREVGDDDPLREPLEQEVRLSQAV